MKQTLIIFTLLCTLAVKAQLPTVADYQQQQTTFWSTSLATLKTNTARRGGINPFVILYDKVAPFAGLFTYNEADNNGSHARHFMQALSEMYRASDKTKFESAETLTARLNALDPSIVPIGILNTDFSYLNYTPENPTLNGLSFNGGVYTPIAGKQSYGSKHITVIAPLKMLTTTANGAVTYNFDSLQWYNYTSKVITFYYQAPNCSSAKISNDISLYTIYPNPSKDIVNVDLRDQNNQPDKDATISGELFDIMGLSIGKIKIKDNKATFDVGGLIKGIYILNIKINKQLESHQIIVE